MPQEPKNIDKKRIAKNTLILYIRMLFLMLVGFYTVRLLLASLGVEDYGLYNIIFGLVTTFSFFSGAMHSTVQRFLCDELGRGNSAGARLVFGVSVFLFLLVALAVFLLAETVGLWFVHNKMTIPAGRMETALTVYQISIFMVILKLLQIPYISAITSHENMGVYSWMCIADSFLHLVSVLILKFILADKLICFVSFYTASNFLILGLFAVYCYRKYDICRIGLKPEKEYLKSMTAFFSWNLFGAVGSILKQQGLNLLLNVFFGVVLNATWGIANQVGNAVNQLVASFQQAFNPQILKSYDNADKKAFFELLQSCSKYSFMLIWLVSFPVLLQTEFLLKLWLGNKLPEGAVVFTQLMIVYMLFEALSGPMWVAVQASGSIKRYQIEISCLLGSAFLFSFIALKSGFPAVCVPVINAAVNMGALVYRLFYLQRRIDFSAVQYCRKTIVPAAAVAALSCAVGFFSKLFAADVWYAVILHLFTVCILNLLISIVCGLSSNEKKAFRAFVLKRINLRS